MLRASAAQPGRAAETQCPGRRALFSMLFDGKSTRISIYIYVHICQQEKTISTYDFDSHSVRQTNVIF